MTDTSSRSEPAAINADCDGNAGTMAFAGPATLLHGTTDEAREGTDAYLEKREPEFDRFKRHP